MKTRNQIIQVINCRKNYVKREIRRLTSNIEWASKNYDRVAVLRGKLNLLQLCVFLSLQANTERVQEIHNLSKAILNTTESTLYGAFQERIYQAFLGKKNGVIVTDNATHEIIS